MEKYRQFVLEGVQHQPEIWSNLKGQIYLGDAAFVTEMQKRIGREKDDLNIPQQQKRPVAKPLSEIAAQHKDRRTAIIATYKTGAYSQREIGENYHQLHPTNGGWGYSSQEEEFLVLDLTPFCANSNNRHLTSLLIM